MFVLEPDPRENLSRAPHMSWLLNTTTSVGRRGGKEREEGERKREGRERKG